MVLRKLVGLFVCTLILGVASFATAGIPDLDASDATIANSAEALSLFCLPNGLGENFDSCRGLSAGVTDGTITVVLRDANDDIIPGFPGEDIWLQSEGMVPCVGGAVSDGDTDVDGETTFSFALNAGGYTDLDAADPNCHVIISGDPITSTGSVFALYFNSADMNADGIVDLIDVTLFSSAFYGDYNYGADFLYDGILDLLDVTFLAAGIGAECP